MLLIDVQASETTLSPPKGRAVPTLWALAVALATALAYLVPMYFVGLRVEDSRRFLKNYRAPNEFEAFTTYCMDYAQRSDEPNDVVFLGDSSLRCDLRTAQFEQQTGLRAYNLGSVGLIGMEGYNVIFKEYMRHHPKPRLLVIGVLPSALTSSPEESAPPNVTDVRHRFFWCYGTGTQQVRPPQRLFLDYCRQGIQATYGSLVGGFARYANEPVPARGGETFESLQRAVTDGRGFWPVPVPRKAVEPPHRKPKPFKMDDRFEKALAELAELTAGSGIALMVRLTPMLGEPRDDLNNIHTWAAALEGRFPHVVVGRPELLDYGPDCFADANHCNAKGVERFTDLVAEEVKVLLSETGEGSDKLQRRLIIKPSGEGHRTARRSGADSATLP